MLIAPTLLLLLALPAAPELAPTLQDEAGSAAQQNGQQDEEFAPESWEAFNALVGKYLNAVGAYQFEVKELHQKRVPRDEWPAHPIGEYFPRFRELADQGNGQAAFWLIENVRQAPLKPDERLALTKHYFTLLATEHASREFMVEVTEVLVSRRRKLGDAFITETLRAISENSELFEVDAMALFAEAEILFNGGSYAHPGDRERVADLWRVLVDGYAGTEAAKRAADYLFRRTIGELLKAAHAWLDGVSELHAQGVGPEGWPPFPLAGYAGDFEAMASTGHVLPEGWVKVFHPGFEQALRKGIQHALLYFGGDQLRPYLTGHLQWLDIHCHARLVLYEVFPDEPWVFESVGSFQPLLDLLDTEQTAPVLRMLIDRTSDDRVRYEAMFTLGRLLEFGDEYVENAEALELYQCVMDNSPVERQRKEAEKAHREFSWTMPGALLPNFTGLDAEGFEVNSISYRGRVTVLFFWLLSDQKSMEELPWINELAKRFQSDEFALLGINSDTTTRQMFITRAIQADITWRNVLQQGRAGRVSEIFRLNTFPTTFIVDTEGVIRGRNLPHDQSEALIQQLLAEARQGTDPAGTGSGGGDRPR